MRRGLSLVVGRRLMDGGDMRNVRNLGTGNYNGWMEI